MFRVEAVDPLPYSGASATGAVDQARAATVRRVGGRGPVPGEVYLLEAEGARVPFEVGSASYESKKPPYVELFFLAFGLSFSGQHHLGFRQYVFESREQERELTRLAVEGVLVLKSDTRFPPRRFRLGDQVLTLQDFGYPKVRYRPTRKQRKRMRSKESGNRAVLALVAFMLLFGLIWLRQAISAGLSGGQLILVSIFFFAVVVAIGRGLVVRRSRRRKVGGPLWVPPLEPATADRRRLADRVYERVDPTAFVQIDERGARGLTSMPWGLIGADDDALDIVALAGDGIHYRSEGIRVVQSNSNVVLQALSSRPAPGVDQHPESLKVVAIRVPLTAPLGDRELKHAPVDTLWDDQNYLSWQ